MHLQGFTCGLYYPSLSSVNSSLSAASSGTTRKIDRARTNSFAGLSAPRNPVRSMRSLNRVLYLDIWPSPYAPPKRLAPRDASRGISELCSPLRSLACSLAPRFREEVEAQPGDGRVEDYVRTYDRVHQDAAGLAPGEGTSHPGTHRADNEERGGHARVDSGP